MARENTPAVIFIDEIDALANPRSEGESEASRRIKTEFLIQMEGVGNKSDGVLVLAATNIPWNLDQAILRRFQVRVHIGLPDERARIEMFKLLVKNESSIELNTKDLQELSRMSEGFSGSDIKNAVKTALMRPVRLLIHATHFKPVSI
jgi:vacuolar protein-sorting-associated protein 4